MKKFLFLVTAAILNGGWLSDTILGLPKDYPCQVCFNLVQRFQRKRFKCDLLSKYEWRVRLSDTILKWDYPRTIPARFALIWFSGFRGKDLNVIFYQNMPNLHNRYKSAERKISQKNPEYMLNYSLPCSCS